MFPALLLLLMPALGAMPDDLAGRWILDSGASESVDALLAASGASWAERVAAATVSVTQDMRVERGELVIVVESTVMDRQERLPLDGQVQKRQSRRGEPMEVRTTVEGAAVVTRSRITSPDGSVSVLEIARVVEDGGGTLRQTVRYSPPGKTPLEADRVFRRAQP